MKRIVSTKAMQVLIALTLTGAATGAIAENQVKGSLTVDGTTEVIKHIYFDQYGEEFTIILTDKPVAQEMIPDGLNGLSEQGKVRALEFTVSRKTKKLLGRLRKSIYFHPVWTRNISIGNGELALSRFDEKILAGTITTRFENEFDGHKFSYDVSFTVDLKKEPLKLQLQAKAMRHQKHMLPTVRQWRKETWMSL